MRLSEKENRMIKNSLMDIYIVAMLSLILLPVNSCKKESTPSQSAPVQVINPYSDDSVFVEVKKRLDENPQDVDALYHLADLYDRNGHYEEAIENYKKVVKLRPDMGYAYFKMGTAYNRLDRAEEAIAAFKKAIRYLPDYAVIYNNMGIAYGRLNRVDDEIDALKKAIRLRPRYASARYNLGKAYLKKKDIKASMREYEYLKDIDTGTAEALLKEIKDAS